MNDNNAIQITLTLFTIVLFVCHTKNKREGSLFIIRHLSSLISHFSFLISHFSFLISHLSSLIHPFPTEILSVIDKGKIGTNG